MQFFLHNIVTFKVGFYLLYIFMEHKRERKEINALNNVHAHQVNIDTEYIMKN